MRLSTKNLTLERGGRTLVSGLSLEAGAGEAIILKGPNGSGKTTLLRTLAGFLKPAGGTISLVGGQDDEPLQAHCHYLGHQNGLKASLTVAENLLFYAAYLDLADGGKAIPAKAAEARTHEALQRLRLAALADVAAGYLSAGQKRRVGLARLVAARRPVWLLDEPVTSLDVKSCAVVSDMMREHVGAGGVVIAATHSELGLEGSRTIELGGASGAGT